MMGAIRRVLVRGIAAMVLLAIVAGLPTALVVLIGWPLPHALPSTADLSGWLTTPISDTVILNGLAVSAWLLWAAFIPAVMSEARAARHGYPTAASTGRTLNPLRIGAATLITALTLGTLPGTAATTHATTREPALARTLITSAAPNPARGPATIHVGATRYSYTVHQDDTLSAIAAAWLGDADRWPEICRLNWHRHWPTSGGRLTDCDLIYPGWDLRLPPDATPPRATTPVAPAPKPVPESPLPTVTSGTTPPPTSPDPSVATSPGGVTQQPSKPSVSPLPTTAIDTAPSPTPSGNDSTPPRTPRATSSPPDGPTTSDGRTSPPSPTSAPAPTASARPIAEQDGITLPNGFLPWTLATAISAAVALVWLHRRRRHTLGALDDDPTDLPEPVLDVTTEVLRNPSTPADPDLAERAAQVPETCQLPPGGIGLIGDGAHAAARAALIAALASGGPRDPDRQGEVIIDGGALTTLIGVDAAALGPWPRLHVADDLDHALALVEARLLQRARLLDEHALTDLDALRTQAPDEEPVPPILLVIETPPAGTRMRVKTVLALGADVEITAVLLGEWAHGPTLAVHVDGRGHSPDGGLPDGFPERLGVLDTDAAVAVLATLREAHTGQRPAITTPTTAKPSSAQPATNHDRFPSSASRTASEEHAAGSGPSHLGRGIEEAWGEQGAAASPEQSPAHKALLRVFGTPRVDNITAPGQPLRAKAAELAVFLACHPDGVDTRTIGDHLERGVRMRSADVRVHTNVSNLRHVMGRAAGQRKIGYVIKPGGRYRLDPTSVDVDLWQLRDLTTRAATASARERLRLLRRACDLYTAPLADACDYDWVEPHREKARQQASDAHLLLADALLPDDPQGASEVLDRAIGLDRYNEALYRKAMEAHHALGDRDRVRILLQALTIALADLDAEPDDETVGLAEQLRSGIRHEGRP